MVSEWCAVSFGAIAAFLALPSGVADDRLRRLAGDGPGLPAATSRSEAEGSGESRKPATGVRGGRGRRGRSDGRVRHAVCLLAGFATAVLIGGPPGWVAGVVVTVGAGRFIARLEPRAARVRRVRIAAELPLAVDLLAACLRGGGAWHDSVDAVARALGGPLGDELAYVAARVRLGADPEEEWLRLAHQPVLAPLGRVAARVSVGGVPAVSTLTRLAHDQRRRARATASARAHAAGVWAVVPLGLCFLPAFVLLGIVPAIVGIAASILIPW